MTDLSACTCVWVNSATGSAVYIADAGCRARPHPNRRDRRLACPHGDEWCPCPEGDPCHYTGPAPATCPTPGHCPSTP